MQEVVLDRRGLGRSFVRRRIGPAQVRRRRTFRQRRRRHGRDPDPEGCPQARVRRRDGCSNQRE